MVVSEKLLDKWIPGLSRENTEKLLRTLGIDSFEDLFKDIPSEMRLSEDEWNKLRIGYGKPLSEKEVDQILSSKLGKITRPKIPPFLGGGAWYHYRPSYIDYIISMGEFLTSYTPYQPEASQGLLQALFEYQSLIAEIYELDVVVSSHYDWSTSLAEAMLMALRITRKRKKVILPDTINPRHVEVLESYLGPHNVAIEFTRTVNGVLDLEDLGSRIDNNTAAVYFEMPTYLGVVDPGLKKATEIAHDKNTLVIIGADPLASTIYSPPGELGADIAVGDAQPLGLGLNYGGPYLGIIAVKDDKRLIRQLPGRIVGLTRDKEGNRAFSLILQTREQHIRRAKATSNITTNEALMALAAAAFIAGHGRHGLEALAHMVRGRTIYLKQKLGEIGVTTIGEESFRDISVCFKKSFREVSDLLEKNDILIGPGLEDVRASYVDEHCGIIAVTEMHSRTHIDELVKALAGILKGKG